MNRKIAHFFYFSLTLAMCVFPSRGDTVERSVGEAPHGMVFVQGGCFEMGDTFGDGYKFERPVHRVCLDDFYLDKYEVTNAEFESFKPGFAASRSVKFKGIRVSPDDNNPVVMVVWYEAKDYCKSQGKRLPTEAEWEYAARGRGERIKYAWGDDVNLACDYSNVADKIAKGTWPDTFWMTKPGWSIFTCNDRYVTTAPVGSFSPNKLGLYDMTGNVWEWVEDWYDVSYYSKSPEHNPKGPANSKHRVIRGGSFLNITKANRVAFRNESPPRVGVFYLGFRCAQ